MLNILVTGANGQLGSEIREISSLYPHNFIFTDKNDLDITNKEKINIFVSENSITAIINCAAYTAVDKAESDLEMADKVNHIAVGYLAEIAKDKKIKLIHISTDYVFDGTACTPYAEEGATNPKSAYGLTKLNGEKALCDVGLENSIIIRTSWVYSSYGANFVKTMLRLAKERESLGVVYDQIGAPTYARDLAKAVLDILPQVSNNQTQIYHYANEGVLSWYDFAKEIMRMAKLDCKINPIETKDYPTPAKRPSYSLFNKSKIKNEFGIQIPYWKDSLDECLVKMGVRK